MNNLFDSKTHQSGVSLIEALISLLILSFGLLAIASFQTKLISGSGENKARSEAIQLAQQKLDEFRNYTNQEQLVASLKDVTVATGETFPEYAFGNLPSTVKELIEAGSITACNFTATPPAFTNVVDSSADEDPDTTGNQIIGNNAVYSREWNFCLQSSELLYAMVEVKWTDIDGSAQTISLDSNITWKNVTATAELANVPAAPLIPSATGRAYLGDGSVTQAQLDGGTDNLDGTTTVLKANDGADVALVDSDTKEIVLTLVDACKTQDNTCFGFVKIKGRVYFDSSSGLTPSTVYVLASDAAYCARVFDTSGADTKAFTVPDTNSDTSDDYTYFDYTCYLGGGWYGNIGLLFTAGANAKFDRACVGDPSASFTDGLDKWKRPEVAKRRAYRGAVYVREKSGSTYSLWRTKDGTSPISDPYNSDISTAEPLYYTKGIGDSVWLPDYDPDTNLPNWPSRDGGHDYVVYNSNSNTIDYTDCYTPLTRPDSRVWTDVNNDGNVDASELGDVGSLFARTPTDFVCLNDENPANDPRTYPYLDAFNGDSATIDDTKTVYGAPSECPYDPSRPPSSVHFVSGTVTTTGGNSLATITMNTSDGAYDCAVTVLTTTSLTYSCRVYEWGDGWKGQVNLMVPDDSPVQCDPPERSYASTPVTADLANQNFACKDLARMDVSGKLTAYMNDLTGTTVSAVRDNTDGTTTVVPCTVSTTDTAIATYSCTVIEEVLDGGWTGNIIAVPPTYPLTPANDIICDQTVWPETALKVPSTGNDTFCHGPVTTLTLRGQFTSDYSMVGIALPSVTATDSVNNCTVILLDNLTAEYTCEVSFSYQTGWNGTVTIDTSSSPAMSCSPLIHTPGTVTTDYSIPTSSVCTVDQSGRVTISGRIYDLVTAWDYDFNVEERLIDGGPASNYVVMRDTNGNVDGACSFNYADNYYMDSDYNNYGYECTSSSVLLPGEKWAGKVEVYPLGPNIMCTAIVTFDRLRPNSITVQDFAVAPDSATCTANGF